jgi:hypothetical protein
MKRIVLSFDGLFERPQILPTSYISLLKDRRIKIANRNTGFAPYAKFRNDSLSGGVKPQ